METGNESGRRKWTKRIAGATLAAAAVASVTTGVAQQGAEAAQQIAHEVTRTHIEPTNVRLGTVVIHKGTDIWNGIGPNEDPTNTDNSLNWNDVSIKGIPLKDYQSIKGKNVLVVQVPELGTNKMDTYLLIKDAKVGNEEDDVTISASDPNVSHSLDAAYVNALQDANGGYFAYDKKGGIVKQTEIGIFTPDAPNPTP